MKILYSLLHLILDSILQPVLHSTLQVYKVNKIKSLTSKTFKKKNNSLLKQLQNCFQVVDNHFFKNLIYK